MYSFYNKHYSYLKSIYFLSNILRKSSCPFPPEEDATEVDSFGVDLNPKPAFGFDGPRFLGLNDATRSLFARDDGISSLIWRDFPPNTIGSERRSNRPTS